MDLDPLVELVEKDTFVHSFLIHLSWIHANDLVGQLDFWCRCLTRQNQTIEKFLFLNFLGEKLIGLLVKLTIIFWILVLKLCYV